MYFIYTEQNVDGETLLMVSMQGSYDQLKACGLKTVADQMKLQKLITKSSGSAISNCKSDSTSGQFPRAYKSRTQRIVTRRQKSVYYEVCVHP